MDFVNEYKKLQPKFESLGKRLNSLLSDIANNIGVDVHAIEHRAKSVEGFSEKMSRPGKSYKNPIDEITDLCGLRVILYYQEDVDLFVSALRDELYVDDVKSSDKKTELNSDQFGYVSVHMICQLNQARSTLLEWREYVGLSVEIQVRTVLQHAWASISHGLQYKSRADIPDQFVRQLSRISGLLELSDEQFSELRIKSAALNVEISESIAKRDLHVSINNLALSQYVISSATVSAITLAAEKAGFAQHRTIEFEQLGGVCLGLGISTLQELDSVLSEFEANADHFFRIFAKLSILDGTDLSDTSGDPDHWCAIALVAMKCQEADVDFVWHEDIWSKSYLNDVVRAALDSSL